MTLSRVNAAMFDMRGHTSLHKPLIIRRMHYNKCIVLIIFSDKCIRLISRVYSIYLLYLLLTNNLLWCHNINNYLINYYYYYHKHKILQVSNDCYYYRMNEHLYMCHLTVYFHSYLKISKYLISLIFAKSVT